MFPDNFGTAHASLRARVVLGGQPVDSLLNGQVNVGRGPGDISTLGTLSAGSSTVALKVAVVPAPPRRVSNP